MRKILSDNFPNITTGFGFIADLITVYGFIFLNSYNLQQESKFNLLLFYIVWTHLLILFFFTYMKRFNNDIKTRLYHIGFFDYFFCDFWGTLRLPLHLSFFNLILILPVFAGQYQLTIFLYFIQLFILLIYSDSKRKNEPSRLNISKVNKHMVDYWYEMKKSIEIEIKEKMWIDNNIFYNYARKWNVNLEDLDIALINYSIESSELSYYGDVYEINKNEPLVVNVLINKSKIDLNKYKYK